MVAHEENISISTAVKTRAFVQLQSRVSVCWWPFLAHLAMDFLGDVNWFVLTVLTIAGFLLSGASVTINQIMERD